ncbi:hypothetical protein D047_0623B, partial [Vibrio parahaemolyticus VPTS-2010_2]
EVKVLPSPFML